MRYYPGDTIEIQYGLRFVGTNATVLCRASREGTVPFTADLLVACEGMDSYGCTITTELPIASRHVRLVRRPRINHFRALFTRKA